MILFTGVRGKLFQIFTCWILTSKKQLIKLLIKEINKYCNLTFSEVIYMSRNIDIEFSKEQVNSFISRYEPLYFKNDNKSKDIPKLNTTEIEVEEYIEGKLKSGIVDEYVVVWKAGRLKKADIDNDKFLQEKKYINGYGNHIDSNELKTYLSKLKKNEIQEIIYSSDMLSQDILEKSYDLVKENVPTNFGSVYLINILYFLSKGKIPIYDKYAHIAVKALCFGYTPSNIYVGAPPEKSRTKMVINMLSEYMWYLNKLFGTCNIPRSLDRALWVYGHSKIEYDDLSK